MSKRDSVDMENAQCTQPQKKQKMAGNANNLVKEVSSSSIDMTRNKGNNSNNNNKNNGNDDEDDDEVYEDDDIMNKHSNFANVRNIGNISNFMASQVQSIHILGNNTVELSHSHRNGNEVKMTEQIIQQLTQFLIVSNMKILIPNIIETKENKNKDNNNHNDSITISQNLNLGSTDAPMHESKSNDNNNNGKFNTRTDTVIIDDSNDNNNNGDDGSEDNIEEITKNDEICHNKIANLLKYNLQNSSKMGESKIRYIDIKMEGFKGTRSNKFRAQSMINTPTISSVNNNNSNTNNNDGSNFFNSNHHLRHSRSSGNMSIASNVSLSSVNSFNKNKTDRLICYRDEINEKLFEYTDIVLLFPDDNFDVLLNLFEYLRLCELGRTRNTSNPLFSEGIESMGKVLIFNLNGFYNGLNKQFNCYDEDKVENRFVVVVVNTLQEGIERLKMWHRD